MTLRPILGLVVIACLVVTPFLAAVSADTAATLASTRPRQTSGHHDTTPHIGWKTMRATTPSPPPLPELILFARLLVPDGPAPLSVLSRPPFVPPRP